MPPVRIAPLLCLCLLGSGPALAAGQTQIALVGAHVPSWDVVTNADVTDSLASQLEQGGQFEVLRPDQVSSRLSGRESLVLEQAFLGPGEAAYDEGRVLYQRAEFEDAMATLERAVGLLREGLPVATDSKVLIDALLLQGLTHFSIGDDQPARAAFQEVVRLDPSRRLDPVNYSGPTVDFFEEVRTAVMEAGTGSLQVSAEEGAQVYVDARLQGTGDQVVDGLPAGEHSVLVLGSGGKRAFEVVEVQAGDTTKARPELTRSFLVVTSRDAGDRSRKTGLLYAALASHVGADMVLLTGQTTAEGEVRAQLFDQRTGTWSQSFASTGSEPSQGVLEAAVGLRGFLDESGALLTDKVAPRAIPLDIEGNELLLDLLLDPEPPASTAVTGTGGTVVEEDDKGGVPWWVWAGGAAVLAGGGATAAVLATSASSGGTGTIFVGPMP